MNVQTQGLKKYTLGTSAVPKYVPEKVDDSADQKKWSSLAGKKRKDRLALLNGFVVKSQYSLTLMSYRNRYAPSIYYFERVFYAFNRYKNNDDDDDDDGGAKERDLNVIGIDEPSSSEDDDDDDENPENGEKEGEEEVVDNEDGEEENEEEGEDDEEEEGSVEEDNSNEMAVDEKPENDENSEKLFATQENISEESSTSVKVTDNIEKAPEAIDRKPAVYVHVSRVAEVQAARLKLPILAEEQVIMETINENNIIILAGETGSGKTTQVPQFLYEAGYAEHKMIAVTEPRRVAAISMSKRVAHEMNLSTDVVSYLIRFEGNTTDSTKIKFMTDGVLLKEIEADFVLSKYSVIILDEAHERSVYTDILVGLLSRIVPLRQKRGNPLKLIVMSATLRVEDFTNNRQLFKKPPPVMNVETRQFPVTIHFNKHTTDDYINEAYNKTVKIHTKLPEGGILIFLTGQQEVNNLVRKLRKAFPYNGKAQKKEKTEENTQPGEQKSDNDDSESDDEFNIHKAIKQVKKSKKKLASQLAVSKINLDDYKLPSDDTEADLLDANSDNEAESDSELGSDSNLEHLPALKKAGATQPLWVLPLYSLLPSHKQQLVFDPPPEGARLCVVSTNVAETSLTIPNIKYVVDSGRQKTRLYDKVTGVSAFVVTFASKAAANQRSGRAGRTSAGHCYRLYSSAKYNDDFIDFAMPDIQKKPVEDLMLQMKCMGIDKVVNFPFPSPPDVVQLKVAEDKLKLLGALEPVPNSMNLNRVTNLGKAIAAFPVAPRFGKMLALSHQQNLLPYTACLVAALSVQEVFTEVSTQDEDEQIVRKSKWQQKRKIWAGTGNTLLLGDPGILLRAVGAAEYAHSTGKLEEFCQTNGMRVKAVTEIRKLRIQLTNEINLNMPDVELSVDPKLSPPTDIHAKLLRQILLAGMGDQVARLIPQDEINDKDDKRKLKYAYKRHDMVDPVFLHSSSVLRSSRPEWVVYQEIYELRNGDTTKMFMRGVTAIEPEWLLIYSNGLCNIKTIKEDPSPRYNERNGKIYCHCEATFGQSAWEIPAAEIEMPVNELVFK